MKDIKIKLKNAGKFIVLKMIRLYQLAKTVIFKMICYLFYALMQIMQTLKILLLCLQVHLLKT